MKKGCDTCLKNDRNHRVADCFYCMQFNNIILSAEKYISEPDVSEKEDKDPFFLNLTTIKLPHPGGA